MSKQNLKIGITCYPTFGGSGVIATEIGMAMAKQGHSVHFICYDVPRRLDRYTDNVYFHEVEVHENPLFTYPPYSLALASKMVEVTTYENLDLLHVHYAVPHATSAYLAKQILKNGKPAPAIITTLHGTDITLVGNERNYLPITRFSIIESDGVTVPSQFLKHATYDKLNVPTSKEIEVIPNFVDTDKFAPASDEQKAEFRKKFGRCPLKGKLLVHVSNFRPVKRIEDIVSIFDIVRRDNDAHLLLVGDGPERSRVEHQVHDLGLKESVCFLGKQESTDEIIKHCDVFLLPSKNESFGLAALEAMSCGLPVVGSNAEGIPEVVRHGETGFLSDVGDVEEMAENVTRLLTDETLYARFSEAARRLASEDFHQMRMIESYQNYYHQILEQRVS